MGPTCGPRVYLTLAIGAAASLGVYTNCERFYLDILENPIGKSKTEKIPKFVPNTLHCMWYLIGFMLLSLNFVKLVDMVFFRLPFYSISFVFQISWASHLAMLAFHARQFFCGYPPLDYDDERFSWSTCFCLLPSVYGKVCTDIALKGYGYTD